MAFEEIGEFGKGCDLLDAGIPFLRNADEGAFTGVLLGLCVRAASAQAANAQCG
jgi:hypothetical protein